MPALVSSQLSRKHVRYSIYNSWGSIALQVTYRRFVERGYGQNVEVVRLRPENMLQHPRQGVLRLLAAVRCDANVPGSLRLQGQRSARSAACRRPALILPMGVLWA